MVLDSTNFNAIRVALLLLSHPRVAFTAPKGLNFDEAGLLVYRHGREATAILRLQEATLEIKPGNFQKQRLHHM